MRIQYFTFNDIDSIVFAGEWNPVNKIRKNINVKGYVRKGKFVRSSNREQNVRETAVKIAAVSLGVLATVLGVSIASAALTKVRYNKNLVDFGKKIKDGRLVRDMKVPSTASRYVTPWSIVDLNKKSMTFFSGGLDKVEEVSGEQLLVTVAGALRKQKIAKNHELIPLYHNYQKMKGGRMQGG